MKRFKRLIFISLLLLGMTVIGCDWYVSYRSKPRIYSDISTIPTREVGLVLGTSKTLKSGAKNLFFSHRIEATARLYHAGKIRHILVSGDNGEVNYNEPKDMRDALIARGIPAENIHLDYAGFSTYESIVRAEKVFDTRSYILISQDFHVRRGIFIALHRKHDALGFAAEDVAAYGGFRTKIREKLARIKVMYDVWFEPEPTYLGDHIKIR